MNFIDFVEKIASFEGCPNKNGKCYAYTDAAGVRTIGYGFTESIYINSKEMTVADAKRILSNILEKYRTQVDILTTSLGYNFNNNQLLALTSFTYNCGLGNLRKLLNDGKRTIAEVSAKIPAYNKAGGKVLNGLVKRRAWEKELFNTPVEKDEGTIIDLVTTDITSCSAKQLQELANSKGANLVVDGKIGPKSRLELAKLLNKL